ncbi:hypothetical protein JOY44_01645 [Phormidium sp. CLA17]|uniref:hypothetical protein n=1 Tax=Leptolyngbya sp. Cla-17 TaxID=2803751 RepID=UPI001491E3AA|nr:hypothetical protein [Leptolyngbya sp. Cla-17]MBM0740332.1 hypothetical protein [Leptolyngbya sp. Cla-17]
MNFWDIEVGAISLNPETYRYVVQSPSSGLISLGVLLISGLSEAIAQGIVLFVNRVKPIRFVLSLAIASILFVFGFLFWAGSTWIVLKIFLNNRAPFAQLLITLAISFAPKVFSVFIALPYLGVPISIVLSIWSFLAFLVGIQATLGLGLWQGFWCGVLGWAVLQLLQRTVGRPVANIGHWIRNSVAGVPLVTNLKDLERIIAQGRRS